MQTCSCREGNQTQWECKVLQAMQHFAEFHWLQINRLWSISSPCQSRCKVNTIFSSRVQFRTIFVGALILLVIILWPGMPLFSLLRSQARGPLFRMIALIYRRKGSAGVHPRFSSSSLLKNSIPAMTQAKNFLKMVISLLFTWFCLES